MHPDDRHLIEEVSRSPESLITVRWLRKDGAVIWIEQRIKGIYDGVGELVAIESIARDVTGRKRVEALGARIDVRSRPGEDTKVTVSVQRRTGTPDPRRL